MMRRCDRLGRRGPGAEKTPVKIRLAGPASVYPGGRSPPAGPEDADPDVYSPIPILPGRGISPVRDYLVRMTISVYGLVGGTPPESAVIPANPPVGTPNRAYAVPPLREYDRVSPTPLVSGRGTSW